MRLIWEATEAASKELGYLVQAAIALDTKDPEIRTGLREGNPDLEVEIKINDNLHLSINRDQTDKSKRECIYVDYLNTATQNTKRFYSDALASVEGSEYVLLPIGLFRGLPISRYHQRGIAVREGPAESDINVATLDRRGHLEKLYTERFTQS
uniref:Pyruvate kinase barrel domain-containing protein n=1 Tax=Glossina austeni TaxID=7395 RepID=A0A1A9V8U9_GLOAU